MFLAIVRIKTTSERDALEKLFRAYYSDMLRAVMYIIPNKPDAEDIVVNATLSLFDKVQKLSAMEPNACRAYMVKTAKRLAFKYTKAQSKQIFIMHDAEIQEIPTQELSPCEITVRDEHSKAVRDTLSQLSARDRRLLELRYYEERTTLEMADVMHLSPANIGKYLHVARKRALALLGEVFRDES